MELTLSAVEYETALGRKRKGVCSHWIFRTCLDQRDKYEGEAIPFYIKPGSFPPFRVADNYLFVATGTGVAPLRSFLWEKYHLVKDLKEPKESGRIVLFFGCRNKGKDFLYAEEYQKFSECQNMNFHLIPAFSREKEDKVYVQHLIKENAKLVSEFIFELKGKIFLVGSSKVLPKSVDKALKFVLQKKGVEESEVDKMINYLKKTNRYYIETW